jgi:hypothetical protein
MLRLLTAENAEFAEIEEMNLQTSAASVISAVKLETLPLEMGRMTANGSPIL